MMKWWARISSIFIIGLSVLISVGGWPYLLSGLFWNLVVFPLHHLAWSKNQNNVRR